MSSTFAFEGTFRVQSRLRGQAGKIVGAWLTDREEIVTSGEINSSLGRFPHWSGERVNIRPALITIRDGSFAEAPDNLYKIDCFEPDQNSGQFPCHIIDVSKAMNQWRHRKHLAKEAFADSQLEDLIEGVDQSTIANEYLCHEAGHLLGRSIQSKQKAYYFTPGGFVRWPLIWMEEFRADLHSYAVALEALPVGAAALLFIYNWIFRIAGDIVSKREGTYGYGTIPFLLFSALSDLGLIAVVRNNGKQRIRFATAKPLELADIMRACHLHALKYITEAELASDDPLDWGLNAIRYYRARTSDVPLREDYLAVLSQEGD